MILEPTYPQSLEGEQVDRLDCFEQGENAGRCGLQDKKRMRTDYAYRVGVAVGRARYRQFLRSRRDHVPGMEFPELPRRLSRIVENLLRDICKHEPKGSRRRPKVLQLSCCGGNGSDESGIFRFAGESFDRLFKLAESERGGCISS